jgi:hypothetical protein
MPLPQTPLVVSIKTVATGSVEVLVDDIRTTSKLGDDTTSTRKVVATRGSDDDALGIFAVVTSGRVRSYP